MALGLAAGVLAAPLWFVHSPAMPDYPAHIAGFALIAGGAKAASPFYAVHWALVPNLASELIVPLLAQLMAVETATKLFLSVAVALWVLGPAAIQRALFGTIGVAPLAAAFFAYNANFTWGFFNYYFATGLCFLLFAAWIATENRRPPAALAGFALAVAALYLCHLVAVFLLAVMIAGFEGARLWTARDFRLMSLAKRALPVGAIFLPAAVAFLFFKPAGVQGGQIAFDFADTVGDRFSAAIQLYYSEPAYLLTGALAILTLWGLLYDRVRIHPAMKPLVIVLSVLTLVAPEWALGGWGVHLRLPAVLGAVLFASAEMRLSPRAAAIFGAVLLLLAGFSSATLAGNWLGYDRQFSEFRAALREIPAGSRMLTVLDGDSLNDELDPTPDQPYWHMAEFAIVDRRAFTPLMFTTRGQHVIRVKPPYQNLAAASAQQGSPPDVAELADLAAGADDNDPDIEKVFPYLRRFQCHFDEAIVIRGKGEAADVPDFLTLRHEGSFFAIYDIHPTKACSQR
ncbi:MAG: hypothetical protein KGM97_07080 [Alphaproteobacteria bacterium]|nr:hypothetical protein [Alphaproteobacteria bacterium]